MENKRSAPETMEGNFPSVKRVRFVDEKEREDLMDFAMYGTVHPPENFEFATYETSTPTLASFIDGFSSRESLYRAIISLTQHVRVGILVNVIQGNRRKMMNWLKDLFKDENSKIYKEWLDFSEKIVGTFVEEEKEEKDEDGDQPIDIDLLLNITKTLYTIEMFIMPPDSFNLSTYIDYDPKYDEPGAFSKLDVQQPQGTINEKIPLLLDPGDMYRTDILMNESEQRKWIRALKQHTSEKERQQWFDDMSLNIEMVKHESDVWKIWAARNIPYTR